MVIHEVAATSKFVEDPSNMGFNLSIMEFPLKFKASLGLLSSRS